MKETGLPTPDFFVIKNKNEKENEKDILDAKQQVRFPAVLKPVDRLLLSLFIFVYFILFIRFYF